MEALPETSPRWPDDLLCKSALPLALAVIGSVAGSSGGADTASDVSTSAVAAAAGQAEAAMSAMGAAEASAGASAAAAGPLPEAEPAPALAVEGADTAGLRHAVPSSSRFSPSTSTPSPPCSPSSDSASAPDSSSTGDDSAPDSSSTGDSIGSGGVSRLCSDGTFCCWCITWVGRDVRTSLMDPVLDGRVPSRPVLECLSEASNEPRRALLPRLDASIDSRPEMCGDCMARARPRSQLFCDCSVRRREYEWFRPDMYSSPTRQVSRRSSLASITFSCEAVARSGRHPSLSEISATTCSILSSRCISSVELEIDGEPLTVTRVSSIRERLALRWQVARGDSRFGGCPPLKAARTGVRLGEGCSEPGDERSLGSSVRRCCGRRIAAARLLSNVPSVLCRFLQAAAFAERERLKLSGFPTSGGRAAGASASGGCIAGSSERTLQAQAARPRRPRRAYTVMRQGVSDVPPTPSGRGTQRSRSSTACSTVLSQSSKHVKQTNDRQLSAEEQTP